MDVRVPMYLSESQELGIREPGNHPEDPFLFRKLQMILKTNNVVARLHQVFLAQLDYGVGAARCRMFEPHRPHRAKAQRVLAAPREFLDGQARFEITGLLEFVDSDTL